MRFGTLSSWTNMKSKILLLVLGIGLSGLARGVEPYSKKAGHAYLTLPNVAKGGVLYSRLQGNPKALNSWLSEDLEPRNVLRFILAPLMHRDYDTTEYFPCLAEKVEVSKDYKTYT